MVNTTDVIRGETAHAECDENVMNRSTYCNLHRVTGHAVLRSVREIIVVRWPSKAVGLLVSTALEGHRTNKSAT